MDHKQRDKRVRLLVRKLNKARRAQAKKIDILCNDFVSAQRDFIKRLGIISFTANFYEAIIAATEMDDLLHTAGKLIKTQIPDANVAFFLRGEESFELHLFENGLPITFEQKRIERYFTTELVNNICKANKVCTLDSLLTMGLQASPAVLNKISMVTVPMGQLGASVGFILLCRAVENKLTCEELNKICAVTQGLAQAIACRRTLSPSAEQKITP